MQVWWTYPLCAVVTAAYNTRLHALLRPHPWPASVRLAPQAPIPTSCQVPCLPMMSCFSLLPMCGLGFCPFIGLVCGLLPRGGWGLSPECALPEEHVVYNRDVHYLEDTGRSGARISGRAAAEVSPELPRATWSRPSRENFTFVYFFLTCGGRKSAFSWLASATVAVASGYEVASQMA